MLRARRRLPLFITIVAFLSLLAVLIYNAQTNLLTPGTGFNGAFIVDPPITHADLKSQAQSPSLQTPLVDRIATTLNLPPGRPPGRRFIHAMWTTQLGPAMYRVERRNVGWPAPWMSTTRYYFFSDYLSRTGHKPATTDPTLAVTPSRRYAQPFDDARRVPPYPRFAFFGDVVRYQPKPEATAGIPTITDVYLIPIAGTLGLLIATWLVAMLLTDAARRLCNCRHHRARVAPLLLTLIAAVAISAIAILDSKAHFQPLRCDTAVGLPGPADHGLTRLSIDADRLAELRGPEGDRALTAAILSEIPPSRFEPKDQAVLAVSWSPEFQHANSTITTFNLGRFQLLWFIRQTFKPGPDVTEPGPFLYKHGSRLNVARSHFTMGYSSGRPDQPGSTLTAFIPNIAALITAFWLIWLTTRTLLILVQRRQLSRRSRGSLCLQCRYPIPTAPS